MSIKIINLEYKHGDHPGYYDCSILADKESDITSLGNVVTDGDITVRPYPGSAAMTADGSAKYIFSPSGKWTKVGG